MPDLSVQCSVFTVQEFTVQEFTVQEFTVQEFTVQASVQALTGSASSRCLVQCDESEMPGRRSPATGSRLLLNPDT